MRLRPLSAAPGFASNSRTAWPDCAASCAMPAPMLPAPMTATGIEVFSAIDIDGLLQGQNKFDRPVGK